MVTAAGALGDGAAATRAMRPIRSYVLREGRCTPAQREALTRYWPRYGIATRGGAFDPRATFARASEIVLEIGFGNGEVLAAMAEAHPDSGFLGIEVWRPGLGSLLRKVVAKDLSNVRVMCEDAAEVVPRIAAASLDKVLILFPDPWPKKRHHKRRLVQPEFAAAVARALRRGGLLHLATDWPSCAQTMRDAIAASGGFIERDAKTPEVPGAPDEPSWRPPSRYERRARARRRAIYNLLYEKN